ncbi:unnamed protein product [Paramecium pentaurelia]|uniref:VLIG-type G domain-containing protein n=1 Tax=Paramecium pentaurelia TaxID=43138 RepID=A0A8S1ST76_9CILI|nr:unnamed protein product [Paramecium pentaurelia]
MQSEKENVHSIIMQQIDGIDEIIQQNSQSSDIIQNDNQSDNFQKIKEELDEFLKLVHDDDNLFQEEEEINDYLNENILKSLNEQEKGQAIQYLISSQQNHNKFDFLNNVLKQNKEENCNKSLQSNDKQFYLEARKQNEYIKIFNKFTNQTFIQVNKIPFQISSNKDILEKILHSHPQKINLLFDYNEYQEGLRKLTQIELLQLLIQFINNTEEKLQSIIGAISKRQCQQFQTFINWIQKQDQKQSSTIQNQQFLKNLLSLDLIKKKEDLIKFLTQQIKKIHQNNLNSENNQELILRILEETLQKQICCNIQIDQVYFATTFYFWIQHSEKIVQFHQQISQQLMKVKDKLKENIFKTKKKQYQRENQQQDLINDFLMNTIIFYESEMQHQFLQLDQIESNLNEQNDQINFDYFSTIFKHLQMEIHKNDMIDSQQNFMNSWQQLQQLQFYQIKLDENNQTEKFLIQILWINRQDNIIYEILKDIPRQESELIYFLYKLDDLNKKMNYRFYYLILDILELIIIKNYKICQTIKIFQDQFEDLQSFICVENCIKLQKMLINNSQNILDEGVKILMEIFCDLLRKSKSSSKKEQRYFKFLVTLGGEDYGKQFLMLYHSYENNEKKRNIINFVIRLQFFKKNGNLDSFKQCCQNLFMLDEDIYNQCYDQFNDKTDFQITPIFFKHKKLHEKYPNNINIQIEQFNLSRIDKKFNNQIKEWVSNLNNSEHFLSLLPFLFDIIKRGESIDPLLDQVNKKISNQNKEYMNFKVIFQILYNNSEKQLQMLLLKHLSFYYPIPFLYQNPNVDNISVVEDLYLINPHIYFFIKKQYSIINFSFSKNQTQIGKTELINNVFYRRDKFSIQDTNELNKNTIDLMFDCEFNGSRNLLIADTHGYIPYFYLLKILPLFSLWIIQMDTEEELKENLENIKQLNSQINTKNHKIVLIVRNSQNKQIDQSLLKDLKIYNIQIQYIENLASKGINNQLIQQKIKHIQEYIFQLIMNNQEYKPFNKENFIQILKLEDREGLQKLETTVQEIKNELVEFFNQPKGLFSQKAFPQRYFDQIIKELKEKEQKLYEESNYCFNLEIEDIMNKIEKYENQQKKYKPTKLVQLFQQLIQLQNYTSYTYLVQALYDLNNDSTQKLSMKKQDLLDQIHIHQVQNREDKEGFNILKQNLEECEIELQSKSLSIDIFWRELIKQNSLINQSQELTDQIFKLLMKGESFEFLDGEQFRMDINIFNLLVKSIEKINKNNKVLVIGILGPQSSGKSTILNKIFGCHFFSSVGKSTKGIYFKMIQIKEKSMFGNQFDYILILDTEGLQSPTQKDPLFDKRISLFIFTICDIILINVKGEINSQFKNLVEICIYTLAQIQNAISNTKQISWCFNQNIDTQNKSPFIDQLTQLTTQLFHEDGLFAKNKDQQQNILELIEIKKENIQILSTTATQETWNIEGLNQCWTQFIPNESYSKDAYNYGKKLIENYIQKCKNKLQSFQGQFLGNFFFNSYKMWETIQKLPDLLEFSELIQLQQNQLVSEFYYQLWNENKLTFKSQIPILIKQKIENFNCDLNLKNFQEIKNDLETNLYNDFEIKRKIFEKKLKQFKEEKNIQKNIYQKFIQKLQNEIQNLQTECSFIIQEQIKNHEINLQKNQGFKEINDYIKDLSKEDRIKLQNDEKSIDQIFQHLWGNIKIKYLQERKKINDETQTASLKQIKSYFPQYQLNIENDHQFQIFLREKINKFDLQETEKTEIFEKYQQELKQNQFEKLSKTNLFNINFENLSIIEKIKKSSCLFLSLSELIKIKFNLKILPKQDLQTYINNNFKKDLKKAEGQKKKIFNLLKILELFQVKHDLNKKKELQECISNKDNQGYQNTCDQFIQTIQDYDLNREFQFSNYDQELCEKYMQPQVKIKHIIIKHEEINKVTQDNIIISQKIENIESTVFNKEYLQYIVSPQNYKFKESFSIEFNQLLCKNGKWIHIYSEIYDYISKQVLHFPNNIEIISKDLIQSIMQSIIDYLENHFSMQFSFYGLQLSDIGERCIYYYSLNLIWRFYCLRIWRQQEKNEQEFDKSKQDQYQSFKNEIQQHKFNLSQQRGELLANYLISQYQYIFYSEKRIEIEDQIMQELKQNQNLVQQLDDKLLSQRLQIALLNKMTYQEQVVEYLTNQLKFIQTYVKEYMERIEKEIRLKYQELFNQELRNSLIRVEKNGNILLKNLSDQSSIISYFQKSIRNRFYENNDEQEKKLEMDLEKKLFNLVFNYLLEYEQNEQEIQELDDQYKYYFIHPQKEQRKIFINQSNNTDNQINHMQGFIQSFLNTIKNRVFNFDLEQFSIHENLNQLRIAMIGCTQCCPICNRKCDLDPDFLPHSCFQGHYLRGMRGILLGNSPSLQSCEEIYDDQIINIKETQENIKWKKIKVIYPKWNFKSENSQQIQQNKIRLMKIWSSEIGKLICNQLNKNQNIPINYKSKIEIKNEKKIFYIFILDDSFSMEGQKGFEMMECLRKSIKFMKSNKQAKLSVISFNYKAKLQIEYKKPKVKLIKQIILVGGITNFDPPLILSLDQIKKFQEEVNKIQILIYSDGGGSYPQNSLDQYKALDQQLRNKISFLICTAEKKPIMLLEMVKQLEQSFNIVQLKHNIQSNDLGQCWNEVILQGQLDQVQ